MIFDVPADKFPAESQFSLISMSEMEDNSFNPKVEVYEGDEYWAGELVFANLNDSQVTAMRQFIIKLRGTSGEFWFADPVHKQTAWSGAIVVDGDNQDGISLSVRGAIANQVIAPAGSRFQLGDHLYELTENAVANGTGRAALSFLPDIRIIPNNGDALITSNPKCKCMLLPKQNPPQSTTKRALLTSFKFKFRESLR